MRLIIAAVGRLKAEAERTLFARYLERTAAAGRALGLVPETREAPESRASRAEDRRRDEASALTALVAPGTAIVVLDERGKALTSADFAARLAAWRDGGKPAIAFLIGGADGIAEELKSRASLSLAFGPMTWPHQLVRVMLAEQIYRAATILSGHPYHRA